MVDSRSGAGSSTSRDDGHGIDLTAELRLDGPPTGPTVDLHDQRQRSRVEGAVTSVPGVIGARLVPGFDRQVDELNVLTEVARSVEETVRDVQTVLMARYAIRTDPRVISVVQLHERRGSPSSSIRPVIETVGVVRTGTTLEANVVLRSGETRHRGSTTGVATRTGRHRTVAHATLDALGPMLTETTLVELEGIDLVEVAGEQVALVVLDVRATRAEMRLSGAAVVHDTADDVVARAVLDALNRTLGDPPS